MILIIYTIVHIILWIIGFFKTTALPKGFAVKITMGSSPNSRIMLTASKFNLLKKPKIVWHLKRLIPFKEFIDQPLMKVNGIQFFIHKDKSSNIKSKKMRVSNDVYECRLMSSPDEEAYVQLAELIARCNRYNPRKARSSPRLSNVITTQDCEGIFDVSQTLISSKNQALSLNGYYAHKDSNDNIKYIIFFLQIS